MKRQGVILFLLLAGWFPLVGATSRVPDADIAATVKVTPRFSNFAGGGLGGPGATAYSGQAGVAPTDGQVFLLRSAMGQPMSPAGGLEDGSAGVLQEVREKLYYEYAAESGKNTPETAAFRYKVLLYRQDDSDAARQTGSDQTIRAYFEEIPELFSEADRARALEAERLLRGALIADPFNGELQEAMLDLYYDRAVADLQYAKLKLDELNRVKLEIVSGTPPDSTIPQEIALWTGEDGILSVYRRVLGDYSQLLNDSFGFKVQSFNSSYSSGTPLGYYLFEQRVPETGGEAAKYLDDGGEVAYLPVSNAGPSYPKLYNGHRELVLMMSVLRDYADGLSEAARVLYLAADPNNPSDPNLATARQLLREGHRKVYLDGQLLLGIFPELDPGADPDSGLQSAIDSWESGIRELTEVVRILNGQLNPLGFQPDFLILTTGFQGSGGEFFDSYNTLANWISALTDPPVRPLSVAQAEFDRARARYDDYRGFQDQLAAQLSDVKRVRDNRAFELVGAVPGDANYNPGNPETGLIADQRLSIELAQNRIDRNRQDLANLEAEIEIEVERRGIEAGISNAIAGVQVSYGNQRATLREEIGHWRAAQAAAESINEMVENIFTAGAFGVGAAVFAGVLGVANVGVQTGAEVAIANKEAELERKAALEASEITHLQDDLLDANSQALIKTLTLQYATIAIDSRQAELTMRQELVRLSTLYSELAKIERFYNDDVQFASERLFADPIHFLRTQESGERAQETFREAQDWIFYTVRALEYKWNQPFSRTVGSRTWSLQELFRTRNTRELAQMLAAMELYDGAQSFGPGTGTNTDSLSLREDILGLRDLDNNSQPLFYPDPISGELVRAKEAFRSYLRQRTATRDNGNRVVTVSFSTAFSPAGSQFFLGPEFNNQGQAVERGTWLDKIQWMKINIPGNLPQGGFINGFLSDGGAQLIRNANVGTYDPAEPDAVRNEVTTYSSRLWFTQDGGQSFEFRENLRAPIRMERGLPAGTTTLPDVPENTFFRERSVANSQWTLEFTIFDAGGAPGGLELLRIENVDDVELIINHRFTPRL